MLRALTVVLLLALTACAAIAGAHPGLATAEEAALVARNWVVYTAAGEGDWAGSTSPVIRDAQEIRVSGALVGWFFPVSPRGHVVVPILKSLSPVKAYSDEYDLSMDDAQGFARLIREVLAVYVADYEKTGGGNGDDVPARAAAEEWRRFLTDPAVFDAGTAESSRAGLIIEGPLLTTAWHQAAPYNNMCPPGDYLCNDCTVGNGPLHPCCTGCVATAVAQILRYHEWPPIQYPGGGQHTYFWRGDWTCAAATGASGVPDTLTAVFSDGFTWSDMPDACVGGSCTATQDSALAELCYEVGVAFDMNYGVCESAADAGAATSILPTHFGYCPPMGCDDSDFERPAFGPEKISRADYGSSDEWFFEIAEEIDEGRPVLYLIETQNNPHALVCDGYQYTDTTEYLFHMNYGWGEPYVGWYSIDRLPESFADTLECAIIGIAPRPLGWRDTFSAAHAVDATLGISASDPDGVASVVLYRQVDGGEFDPWDTYSMSRVGTTKIWELQGNATPVSSPRSTIRYYVKVTDNMGMEHTIGSPRYPFEFSILPMKASLPPDAFGSGILIVEKDNCFGRPWWDDGGRSGLASGTECAEYACVEALDILGHECDVYNVAVPGALTEHANGPDTAGMKYYDTQIWLLGDGDARTITAEDQFNLISWLAQAPEKQRNLLIMGNNVSYDLVGAGTESLDFVQTWLAADYVGEVIDHWTIGSADTVPGLVDDGSDWTFLNRDDGECILGGGHPAPTEYFDVVVPQKGVTGAQAVMDYRYDGCGSTGGAGVAYAHPTLEYRSIILGFGAEYMREGTCGGTANYTADGHYVNGIEDRVNLMQNIMSYFGRSPDGPGTDVAGPVFENTLTQARPNPFNPTTRIDYSVKDQGPAHIRIYDLGGRVVKTLLDAELEAGASGHVIWNGTNAEGGRCASGVYFCRMETRGWRSTGKLILLK